MRTHRIRFRKDVNLNVAPPQDTGRVRTKPRKVRQGEVLSDVTLKPYVEDLIEKCDIALPDGSEALGVSYATFQFLDSDVE